MPFLSTASGSRAVGYGHIIDQELPQEALTAVAALCELINNGKSDPDFRGQLKTALEELERIRQVVKHFTLRYRRRGYLEGLAVRHQDASFQPITYEPSGLAYGRWLTELPPEVFPEFDDDTLDWLANILCISDAEYTKRVNSYTLLMKRVVDGQRPGKSPNRRS